MKNHKGENYITMEDFNQIEKDRDNLKHMPDQKLHQQISFFKSGVRIVGYFFIPFSLVTATTLLILSEVITITMYKPTVCFFCFPLTKYCTKPIKYLTRLKFSHYTFPVLLNLSIASRVLYTTYLSPTFSW